MDHPGLNGGLNFSDALGYTPRQFGEFRVYNNSGEDIPGQCLVEVTGTCSESGAAGRSCFKVGKPSADSAKAVLVCQLPIPKDRIGKATLDFNNGGLVIRYDAADGDPALGDSVGTKAGSFLAKKGNSGFTVLKVNTAALATDPFFGKCVFCAIAGGGGGSFALAQATADGTGGTVTLKAIQHLVNLSASPNFEQTGANFTAKYFKV